MISVAVLLVLAISSGTAQDVANGEAIATVLAGLRVVAFQDLMFGELLQGIAKSMPNNDDDSSGIFQIFGAPSRGISVYMTMPDYMALADGSDRMTIAFSSTDCTIDTTVATPSTVVATDGWIDVDPRGLYNLLPSGIVIGAGGQTNVYLGGRVTPSIDQKAGDYSADIIISVAYTGT